MPQITPGTQPTIEELWKILHTFAMLLPVILLNGFIAMPLTEAATISAIASEYLGRAASPGKAFRLAFKRFLPLVGTNIMAGVFIMIAGLACLIPGIYLLFKYWLRSHAVIIESSSGGDALRRSGALMRGNMAKVFVLGLVITVIGLGFQIGVGAVVSIIGDVPGLPVAAIVVQTLVQTTLLIFGAAAGVAVYFSARCQHENFDLTMLAEAVGDEVPEPGAGTL
jgi:hypothetical protein